MKFRAPCLWEPVILIFPNLGSRLFRCCGCCWWRFLNGSRGTGRVIQLPPLRGKEDMASVATAASHPRPLIQEQKRAFFCSKQNHFCYCCCCVSSKVSWHIWHRGGSAIGGQAIITVNFWGGKVKLKEGAPPSWRNTQLLSKLTWRRRDDFYPIRHLFVTQ